MKLKTNKVKAVYPRGGNRYIEVFERECENLGTQTVPGPLLGSIWEWMGVDEGRKKWTGGVMHLGGGYDVGK